MAHDSDIRKLRQSQTEEQLARVALENIVKEANSRIEGRLSSLEASDREQAVKLTKIDGNTEKLKWLDDPTKRMIASAIVTIVTGLFTAWMATHGGHP